MTVRIMIGDVRAKLAELPDESVHCVVTSPPYFGLRDYGVAGQIGLEETPAAFVAVMVEVFREVRRVLRKDGTLWLNLGDSYNNFRVSKGPGQAVHGRDKLNGKPAPDSGGRGWDALKEKDLMGIPWRVAFALQADGWYLRQDIIWSKPNPMPESVTDRCTKSHEYIFLLTKNARYHYDAEAIAETSLGAHSHGQNATSIPGRNDQKSDLERTWGGDTRNRRSVWTVATQPFKEAHFATFPPDLIEPCILAGCPKDCCAKCGAPLIRETSRGVEAKDVDWSDLDRYGDGSTGVHRKVGRQYQKWLDENPSITTGWSPSCSCDAGLARGTVLDPFGVAGTTGLVADRHGRNAILIELNPEYAAIAERRIKGDAGMFAEVA